MRENTASGVPFSSPTSAPALTSPTLDDKWTVNRGRIMISATQALARVMLAQKAVDQRATWRTAGYISGYRGSPLGNFDSTLWSIVDRLKAADIRFHPGVNEDLAATAVRGTQQLDWLSEPQVDGVFALWYGKGPGIDRSIDALKHGNFGGVHPKGGVLVAYGDDHGGKSSTVSHHSEQSLVAAKIPSLYPANVREVLEYGLLAFALSRFSGSWIGLKLVNEIAEQTATIDVGLDTFAPTFPSPGDSPPEGIHVRRGAFLPLRDEQIVVEHRLPLVAAFVRANHIDRVVIRAASPRLGIVTAGKSHGDTMQALTLLGLDHASAAALGISVYKLGCIWPVELEGVTAFADSQATLLVVEEKMAFIEPQIAAILVNRAKRPHLIGKRDEEGAPLIPSVAQLEPIHIAIAIVGRLERLDLADTSLRATRDTLGALLTAPRGASSPQQRRVPFFCSGCPHNRSTRVPTGSLAMSGIGCHGMAAFSAPNETLPSVHMGGEGANWLGLAPYSGTRHIFQNMGDGTYYHSGLLAIRAAIASGANITYKILYNDAVAMTGGQPVDGPLSVAAIVHQLRAEGVEAIFLLSDKPEVHRENPALPKGLQIGHRDDLDSVQREMREIAGCSVLIYEQTCAAEKRRRRKRGKYPDPPKRLFISEAVCEGCGDCSAQSTCVSLMPLETPFGTKRQIDQSSCNKDYTCLNGFCPSFITVYGAGPRKPVRAALDAATLANIPLPPRSSVGEHGFNLMVAGVGGTGVITVSALLGMAAHIEGKAASLFDMTGLSQKNGAVFSHLRIAGEPEELYTPRLGRGEADVLLAFDLVAALADESLATLASDRTRALANSDVVPTAVFQFDRNTSIDSQLLLRRLQRELGEESVQSVDAATLAVALLGDSIATNLFLIGVAAQQGLLPVGVVAIEQAVRLNAVAVSLNLGAFRLGRLWAADRSKVLAMFAPSAPQADTSLEAIVHRRIEHLAAYQSPKYAERYQLAVERVRLAEAEVVAGSNHLTQTFARIYARLLAYKDEYEVARLLTSPQLEAHLKRSFADGGRLTYNLAPPILAGKPVNGRIPKREFSARWMRPLLRTLARMNWLRGTAFDPFGRTSERRIERKLIADYETLVTNVLAKLTPSNHAAAVSLLALADMVRGYGPVKEAAVASYLAALPAALQSFDEAMPEGAEPPGVARESRRTSASR